MSPEIVEETEEIEADLPVEEDDAFTDAEEEPLPREPPSPHAEHLEIKEWVGLRPTPRFYAFFTLTLLLGFLGTLLWLYVNVPAAIGVLVLAALGTLHMALSGLLMARGCRRSYIDVQRTLEPQRIEKGHTFQVSFDATACTFPYPVRARIRDDPGPAIHPLQKTTISGPDNLSYEARAQQRGDITLPGFEVVLRDLLGLWVQRRTYELPSVVEVDPSLDGLWFRRYLNGQAAMGDEVPSALVHLFRDIEHETVREYQPGDRLKDVDWKRASITGEMSVRERRSISEDMVLLLIDAGTSMTIGRGGKRSLDHALEFAREIVTEGNRRNIAIGYFAFDDKHLLDYLPPSRARSITRTLPEHFVRLGDPARLDKEEDERLHTLKQQSLDLSLASALRTGAPGRMALLLFSDLDSTPEAIVQGLSRAAPKGYRTGTILFPPPAPQVKKVSWRHGQRPPKGYRGKRTRKVLRELLVSHGVEFFDMRYRYKEDEPSAGEQAAMNGSTAS